MNVTLKDRAERIIHNALQRRLVHFQEQAKKEKDLEEKILLADTMLMVTIKHLECLSWGAPLSPRRLKFVVAVSTSLVEYTAIAFLGQEMRNSGKYASMSPEEFAATPYATDSDLGVLMTYLDLKYKFTMLSIGNAPPSDLLNGMREQLWKEFPSES